MVVHPADQEFRTFADLIEEIEVALLTTVDGDGHLHTRPLQTLGIGAGRSLWFFTDLRSEKVFELAHDVRLGLGYADPEDAATWRLAALAGCCATRSGHGNCGRWSNAPTIRRARTMSISGC